MNMQLRSILADLLWSRVKADDAPGASDQHWCTAIDKLSKMIPDYRPADPELLYELKYATLNEDVLYGRMTANDAIAEMDKYEKLAEAASFVPPQYREQINRDRFKQWVNASSQTSFTGFKKQ